MNAARGPRPAPLLPPGRHRGRGAARRQPVRAQPERPSPSPDRPGRASPRCSGCWPGSTTRTAGSVTSPGERLEPPQAAGRARLRARHIGVLTQSSGLLGHLTVLENVRLAASLRRGSAEPPRSCSSGWASAAVGTAPAHPLRRRDGPGRPRRRPGRAPTVLLADEPTAEVSRDRGGRRSWTLLRQWRPRDGATVIVTHSAAVAAPRRPRGAPRRRPRPRDRRSCREGVDRRLRRAGRPRRASTCRLERGRAVRAHRALRVRQDHAAAGPGGAARADCAGSVDLTLRPPRRRLRAAGAVAGAGADRGAERLARAPRPRRQPPAEAEDRGRASCVPSGSTTPTDALPGRAVRRDAAARRRWPAPSPSSPAAAARRRADRRARPRHRRRVMDVLRRRSPAPARHLVVATHDQEVAARSRRSTCTSSSTPGARPMTLALRAAVACGAGRRRRPRRVIAVALDGRVPRRPRFVRGPDRVATDPRGGGRVTVDWQVQAVAGQDLTQRDQGRGRPCLAPRFAGRRLREGARAAEHGERRHGAHHRSRVRRRRCRPTTPTFAPGELRPARRHRAGPLLQQQTASNLAAAPGRTSR